MDQERNIEENLSLAKRRRTNLSRSLPSRSAVASTGEGNAGGQLAREVANPTHVLEVGSAALLDTMNNQMSTIHDVQLSQSQAIGYNRHASDAAYANAVAAANLHLQAMREREFARFDALSRVLLPQAQPQQLVIPHNNASYPSMLTNSFFPHLTTMPQVHQGIGSLDAALAFQNDRALSLAMTLQGRNAGATLMPVVPLVASAPRLPTTSLQASSGLNFLNAFSAPQVPTITETSARLTEESAASRVRNRSILMAAASDRDSVSKFQALLREQIVYFEADPVDVQASAQGRNKPIRLGQVGILCRHCRRLLPRHRPRGAAYFPQKLSGIYQSAQNMANNHFAVGSGCPNAPPAINESLQRKRTDKNIVYGGGQQYWAKTALKAGVTETEHGLAFSEETDERNE